jgi:hypothetical protein
MTMIAPVASIVPASPPPAASPSTAARFGFGDDGFGFDDFIDIINPLQHIPVVGTIYRAITGDKMAPAAEIAGGALFGGPLGALLSVADVAFTDATGKPIDQTMLAWVGLGDDDEQPAASAVAQNTPPAVAHNAPAPTAPRNVAPSRAFPAATSRIVPLANYAQPQTRPAPTTPVPPTATAAPASIVPETPVPVAAEHASGSENASPPPAPASASAGPELQGAAALRAALRDSGVDPSSAARAAAAYQASLSLRPPVARTPEGETERN